MACPCFFRRSGVRYPSPTPLWMRRGAEVQTDQGKNLFERSELFLTPAGPSTAGCPQRSGGTQEPGSPFLCLLSFGEAKESELHAGQPPASRTQQKAQRQNKPGLKRRAPSHDGTFTTRSSSSGISGIPSSGSTGSSSASSSSRPSSGGPLRGWPLSVAPVLRAGRPILGIVLLLGVSKTLEGRLSTVPGLDAFGL